MSIRRRSANRITETATDTYDDSETLPRLDRAFVISFLEIEPEVAAALNGEVPEPPVIEANPGSQPYAADQFDYFAPRGQRAQSRLHEEPDVIDISRTAEPVVTWDDEPSQRARRARRPRERKASTRRAASGKSRAAAAAERVAAIKEVRLRPRADRLAAAQAIPIQAVDTPLTVEETRTSPVVEEAPRVEQFEIPSPPVAPAAAPREIRPAPLVRPAPATEPSRLPVQYIDHEKLLVQVAQAGWKIPPATRRQWSYMNFTMPPDPKANLTPRQLKRQEWRDMMKYFRISPYKSHYREDQRATKRLLGQARRARLDVA